jgi:signal transduction histidine kinase/ActR/RegA family two-component response regulator
MTLLFDIAPFSPPATPNTTGSEIYQRFEADPDLMAIAVVDAESRPVALVERNAFLVRMAAQYGYALWSRRPVSHWMKTDPLVADGAMTVAEFCGRVLEERPSELLQGFIVTCAGRYAGVGTALSLLQVTANATASYAQEMSRLAQDAQDALAAKGRFLAVMSHEIRTPLNGVLAVAEIIRRKSSQSDLAPLVDTILHSGGTLLRLLNDALDLSRAEASGLELNEEPVFVPSVVEEIIGLWSAQAELKGVALEASYAGPEDLWVLADRMRIQQVINNLVSNAMKFTTVGGVEVRLRAERDGQYVHLRGEVADTGPGVPQDRLQTIFTPFQQTEDGVRLGGAGLGLAVCRQIIERMDGTIEAGANPHGGALFAFNVPLYGVPEPQAVDQAPGPVEAAGGALHVLVVDDNATNRMVAQTLCEMFGCTSEAVEDGAAAVAAAATGRFGLVLMDVKMPGMDGVEATRRIRSGRSAGSQVPILAVTANADPADAAVYRYCGMNGVVEKPVKPERLLEAMSAVLQAPVPADVVAA